MKKTVQGQDSALILALRARLRREEEEGSALVKAIKAKMRAEEASASPFTLVRLLSSGEKKP